MVLEGENAFCRPEIMGATNPAEAAEGTRKLYASSIGENAVHGSDARDGGHGDRLLLQEPRPALSLHRVLVKCGGPNVAATDRRRIPSRFSIGKSLWDDLVGSARQSKSRGLLTWGMSTKGSNNCRCAKRSALLEIGRPAALTKARSAAADLWSSRESRCISSLMSWST